MQLNSTPFVTLWDCQCLILESDLHIPRTFKTYLFKILKVRYLRIFMNPIFYLYIWRKTTLSWCLSVISTEKKGDSWYYSCPFSFITDLLIWFHSLRTYYWISKKILFPPMHCLPIFRCKVQIFTPPMCIASSANLKSHRKKHQNWGMDTKFPLCTSNPAFLGFGGKIRHPIY